MPQTYATHTRWNPIFHFVVSPITWLYFLHTLVHALREGALADWGQVLLALAIALGFLVARSMALTVQNRVIRLEMHLRLRALLPAPLLARIPELSVRELVALRFAGDAELPSLMQRTLAKEFARPRDIKRAVTDWQGDHLRV